MPFSSTGTLVATLSGCGLALAAFASGADVVDALGTSDPSGQRPRCVFVNSYHRGFTWSDRLEAGLRDTIGDRCELVEYYMDTKHRRDEASIRAATQGVLALIERTDPDVVITADDNAAKYVVVPHLADTARPVVFSGINWTVEEYGFPRDNVTGMVEVAPLDALIDQVIMTVGGARRAAYVAANTLSEHKDFERMNEAATASGIELFALFTDTMADWESAFEIAQQFDVVILGGHSGIVDFDEARAEEFVYRVGTRFSVTSVEWMMPLTMLGYTKIPEEQGEWAGAVTLAILDGTPPATIPLVTNRRFDTWVNERLLAASGLILPQSLLRQAKRFR